VEDPIEIVVIRAFSTRASIEVSVKLSILKERFLGGNLSPIVTFFLLFLYIVFPLFMKTQKKDKCVLEDPDRRLPGPTVVYIMDRGQKIDCGQPKKKKKPQTTTTMVCLW